MSGSLIVTGFNQNISVVNPNLVSQCVSISVPANTVSAFSMNYQNSDNTGSIVISGGNNNLSLAENPFLVSDINVSECIMPNIKISAQDQPKFQGDYENLRNMMLKEGISEEKINSIESELNKLFPSKNEFLHFEIINFGKAKALNIQVRNSDCELKYGHRGDLKFALPAENTNLYLSHKLLDFAKTLKKSINQ